MNECDKRFDCGDGNGSDVDILLMQQLANGTTVKGLRVGTLQDDVPAVLFSARNGTLEDYPFLFLAGEERAFVLRTRSESEESTLPRFFLAQTFCFSQVPPWETSPEK